MAYLSELFRWLNFLQKKQSSTSICKQNRSARYVYLLLYLTVLKID